MILNLGLWVCGLGLLAAGIVMIRGPLARYQQLQDTEANLRRYDSWRGGGRTAAGGLDGPTGADVMKVEMRKRVQLWGGAIVLGILLIVVGFIVR